MDLVIWIREGHQFCSNDLMSPTPLIISTHLSGFHNGFIVVPLVQAVRDATNSERYMGSVRGFDLSQRVPCGGKEEVHMISAMRDLKTRMRVQFW